MFVMRQDKIRKSDKNQFLKIFHTLILLLKQSLIDSPYCYLSLMLFMQIQLHDHKQK